METNENDPLYQFITHNFLNAGFENTYRWIGSIGKYKTNHEIVTSLVVPILSDSRELLGGLVFNIEENAIANTYNDAELKLDYNFTIQDQDGMVISSTHKNKIGNRGYSFEEIGKNENSFFKLVDNKNCLVTIRSSTYNNWNYISIIPVDELMKDTVNNLKRTILMVVAISIIMLFSLSVFINNIFYKPIKQSIGNIKNSLKKKSTAVKIDRNDEIGFVFNSFCDILNENMILMKNIFDQKMFNKDAELKMLEYQINPHFLYNTLDGAICMIELNEAHKAEKMLNALAKLYRMTLDNQIKIVSISEEIENIKYYTIIQDIRYYNRITVDFNIQEEILGYRILKLILQPLVENAINHGMADGRKSIRIVIEAHKENDMVVLIVRDDGVGIPDCKLLELREIIENEESNQDRFYALHNINRRVKLYYGNQYGLTVDSMEGGWTESKITIPVVM